MSVRKRLGVLLQHFCEEWLTDANSVIGEDEGRAVYERIIFLAGLRRVAIMS